MRNVMLLTISYLLLMVVLLSACSDQMDPVSVNEKKGLTGSSEIRANLEAHSISNVYWFEDGSEIEGAVATLLRTDSNVNTTLKTTGLDTHHTYTVWWVIFNYPDECENGCGEPDLFNDDVGGSVLYAAGHVIGGNGKGNFAGSLKTGDLSGCQAPWDAFNLELIGGEDELDMCREGLVDPHGAEIHLVVRTHGERIPGMVNVFVRAADVRGALHTDILSVFCYYSGI
jgi:hypothetical protein